MHRLRNEILQFVRARAEHFKKVKLDSVPAVAGSIESLTRTLLPAADGADVGADPIAHTSTHSLPGDAVLARARNLISRRYN